jgi:hypothetical protein
MRKPTRASPRSFSAINPNRHSPDGRRFKVYSETASGFWQA